MLMDKIDYLEMEIENIKKVLYNKTNNNENKNNSQSSDEENQSPEEN